MRSPPRLHVTRARPYQGGSCLVGGLLESLQLILEKEYVEYIIFFNQHAEIRLWIFRLHNLQHKMLFKVLRVQHEDIFQKQLAEVRKLKSKPRLEGMLFGFPPLIGFQQVVESPPRVLLIPEGVCLRFSDVWHVLQKEICMFLYVSGGYLFICYLHLIHT